MYKFLLEVRRVRVSSAWPGNNPKQILRIRNVCVCLSLLRVRVPVFVRAQKILWLTHVAALQGIEVGKDAFDF